MDWKSVAASRHIVTAIIYLSLLLCRIGVYAKKVQGVRIHIDSNIPTARGLGSSATCIVAGITAASAMFHNAMNKYEIFDLAAKLEGHPDNVAPAIFGALCVSFMEEGHASMIRYGSKRICILLP